MRFLTVIAAGFAALGAAAPVLALTPPESGELNFQVLRNGNNLGDHVLTFEQTADGDLRVVVDVDLQVRVGPFVPFRYRHDIEEIWSGGQLESLVSTTLKDGDDLAVRAVRAGERIEVDGPAFVGEAEADLLTTSWWNKDLLTRDRILDTETGNLMPIVVRELGVETIEAEGRQIQAERYQVEGTITLDLWYDEAGRWVKCAFEARGSDIEYVLRAPQA